MMTIDNRLADESSPSNVHTYIYIYSVFLLLPSSFLSLPFFVYNTSLYLSCLIPLHILDIYLRDLCPPLPFLRVSVCTSTPYGRSHERDRWNAHRYTHTRARLRAEEPLMNLAVLRPPVRVSPWERTNGKTVSDVYENRISPFYFSLSLSLLDSEFGRKKFDAWNVVFLRRISRRPLVLRYLRMDSLEICISKTREIFVLSTCIYRGILVGCNESRNVVVIVDRTNRLSHFAGAARLYVAYLPPTTLPPFRERKEMLIPDGPSTGRHLSLLLGKKN